MNRCVECGDLSGYHVRGCSRRAFENPQALADAAAEGGRFRIWAEAQGLIAPLDTPMGLEDDRAGEDA